MTTDEARAQLVIKLLIYLNDAFDQENVWETGALASPLNPDEYEYGETTLYCLWQIYRYYAETGGYDARLAPLRDLISGVRDLQLQQQGRKPPPGFGTKEQTEVSPN